MRHLQNPGGATSSLPVQRQIAGSEDAAPPMHEVLQVPLYTIFPQSNNWFYHFFLLGTENIPARRFEMKVEVEQRKWSSRLELVRKNRCLYAKTSLFRHLNYFFCVFHR